MVGEGESTFTRPKSFALTSLIEAERRRDREGERRVETETDPLSFTFVPFSQQLNVGTDEVEDLLVNLILDGKVKGKIDQVAGRLDLDRG